MGVSRIQPSPELMEENSLNSSDQDSYAIFQHDSVTEINEGESLNSPKTDGQVRCYDDPSLVHQMSMPFRDFRVSIFKKTGGIIDQQFYYEPIVSLDPLSIVVDHRFQVSFKIELWNPKLEDRIASYLQLKHNSSVQIIPYEEVQLVQKTAGIFQLPSLSTKSYLQLNESLDFKVFCDNKEAAEMVATPDYLADHLALVFKSPASGQGDQYHAGSASGVKRINRFEFNIVRKTVDEKKPIEDFMKSKSKTFLKWLVEYKLILSFSGVRNWPGKLLRSEYILSVVLVLMWAVLIFCTIHYLRQGNFVLIYFLILV